MNGGSIVRLAWNILLSKTARELSNLCFHCVCIWPRKNLHIWQRSSPCWPTTYNHELSILKKIWGMHAWEWVRAATVWAHYRRSAMEYRLVTHGTWVKSTSNEASWEIDQKRKEIRRKIIDHQLREMEIRDSENWGWICDG